MIRIGVQESLVYDLIHIDYNKIAKQQNVERKLLDGYIKGSVP